MSDIHVERYENTMMLTDHLLSKEICQLLNITEDQADEGDVRIIDQDNTQRLLLLHYLNDYAATRHVHGTIIDIKETPKIVANNFPYPEEISLNNPEDYLRLSVGNNSYITTMTEGTTIRLFIDKNTDKIIFSTPKRIFGFGGRWNDLEFGKTFIDICQVSREMEEFRPFFTEEGDCLMFILSHPLNRIICTVEEPKVIYLGKFNGQRFTPPPVNSNMPKNIIIQRSVTQKDWSVDTTNVDSILEYSRTLKWQETPGLLIMNYQPNGGITCQRIATGEYLQKRNLRGDQPNLSMRYLELYFHESRESLDEFTKLFADRRHEYLNAAINSPFMLKWLEECFSTRYIQDKYLELDPCAHYIVSRAKEIYEPGLTKISTCIREILNTSNAQQLHSILKSYLRTVQ